MLRQQFNFHIYYQQAIKISDKNQEKKGFKKSRNLEKKLLVRSLRPLNCRKSSFKCGTDRSTNNAGLEQTADQDLHCLPF